MSKMDRGGKRKGAGRKPRKIPKIAVNLRLEPETHERLKAICEVQDKTITARISEWIENEDF